MNVGFTFKWPETRFKMNANVVNANSDITYKSYDQ